MENKELKTELFDSVNANGEIARLRMEQKMVYEDLKDFDEMSKEDLVFMIVMSAVLFIGAFSWFFFS